MGSGKKTYIYTDGSDSSWAFIAVRDDKEVATAMGDMEGVPATTDNDRTEGRAIFKAVEWAMSNPGNYVLITDSKSAINKLNGNWKDHTGNADWMGAIRMIASVNESPGPVSFRIVWRERLSDEWMRRVDKMASGR